MQIALFHNLPSGGAKRAVYEWTRRLSLEHPIDVYTLSTADHDFCDIRPFVRKHRVFEFRSRDLFNSPFGRLNQFQRWQDLGDLTSLSQGIASEIDQGKYDVVFAHTCMYSFIPVILQFIRTPTVYYLHEPFGRQFIRNIERPYIQKDKRRERLDRYDPLIGLYKRRLDSLQIKSIKHTDRLLSNSRFTQQTMKETFGIETPVSYYGVDCDEFYPLQTQPDNHHVLSVGELSPRKGFDFLVKSLSCIPSHQRPALRLACNKIDADEHDFLQSLADLHEVELQVRSNLNVEQLREEYGTAKLCVYSPVLEPFGLVPLEAMACGAAVIGVQEGGVSESIVPEQTGLLVERDPDRFAAAIQRLLFNPGLALEYGRNGREHVLRNWTWEQSTNSVENFLEACAGLNRRN
jgi:glycosyltransferase involved in cell wall biosynthesis